VPVLNSLLWFSAEDAADYSVNVTLSIALRDQRIFFKVTIHRICAPQLHVKSATEFADQVLKFEFAVEANCRQDCVKTNAKQPPGQTCPFAIR
jgi:hypothetical protein